VNTKDIMARVDFPLVGEFALVFFFLVFLFILWRVYSPKRSAEMKHMAQLPLEDDSTPRTRGK